MAKKIQQKTKTPMPCREPDDRRYTFDEVATGYTVEMAVQEAARCVECKNKPCISGCPVEIDIPRFVHQLSKRDFEGAFHTLMERNVLPAICGRVCPQESQCEKVCTIGVRFESVAIGRLERFAADYAALMNFGNGGVSRTPTGHKIAVVGSGPAGLTVAADLAQIGHEVTIFEALHEAGGVLIYGIPEFRLPKDIVVREIQALARLGVDIRTNQIIGRTHTVDELLTDLGYGAVFIATGAGLPYFPEIPGVNLIGVFSANEYLTRSNLMKTYRFPEYDTPGIRGRSVAVIGGGNTAMDSVRTSLRLGAKHAYLVYRRSKEEMPARLEELEHAQEEGVEIIMLAAPTEIIGDKDSRVRQMRCIRMQLGEPDKSGRRSPKPIPGSEFTLDVDAVVFAVGQGANPLIRATTPDLAHSKWGNILVDAATGATNKPGVYAGGDVVSGGATVISAMGAGRLAAQAINEYLTRGERQSSSDKPEEGV